MTDPDSLRDLSDLWIDVACRIAHESPERRIDACRPIALRVGAFFNRLMNDGREVCLYRELYRWKLTAGEHDRGWYNEYWTYPVGMEEDAFYAVMAWDGSGSPPGRWTLHSPDGVDETTRRGRDDTQNGGAHMSDTHECPARGCTAKVRQEYLMCGRHWHLVPEQIQRRVYRAWKRGYGAGTEEHVDACRAAIAAADANLSP